MAKQKQRIPLGETSGQAFNNPFAKLTTNAPLPPGPATQAPPEPAPQAASLETQLRSCRPHLRVERKGRGGKTVTLLGGLTNLSQDALLDLAARLKKGLGCGVSLHTKDNAQLLLQGDQTERAQVLLDGLKK